MKDLTHRVLIFGSDPDVLVTLQHAFEEAGIDTAITWDETEACSLLGSKRLDLIVMEDHPPEVDAAAVLQDLSYRGTCPPVLILRGLVNEKDREHFRRLGAIGVVSKRDIFLVLQEATKVLAPMPFRTTIPKGVSTENPVWRAAS